MEEQPIIDSVPDTTAQEQQADTVYQQGLLDFQNGRWDQAAAALKRYCACALTMLPPAPSWTKPASRPPWKRRGPNPSECALVGA